MKKPAFSTQPKTLVSCSTPARTRRIDFSRCGLGSSAEWSAVLDLVEGTQAFTIHAEDAAGNTSPESVIHFFVDTQAPVIAGMQPADQSFLIAAPAAVSSVGDVARPDGFAIDIDPSVGSAVVGHAVGSNDGRTVKTLLGVTDGTKLGLSVAGSMVGFLLGTTVDGSFVGEAERPIVRWCNDGSVLGCFDGSREGESDTECVGNGVGSLLGRRDGVSDGFPDGCIVGSVVGSSLA